MDTIVFAFDRDLGKVQAPGSQPQLLDLDPLKQLCFILWEKKQ